MIFLYGDSTPSKLRSNFLEFLRDALDFSVFVLRADERIARGHERIALIGKEVDAELRHLDQFVGAIERAIEGTDHGPAGAATSRFATRITALSTETHRAVIAEVQHRRAEAIAQIEADENATRMACFQALAALLNPHDVHGASHLMTIELGHGEYDAKLEGRAPFGLAWTFALDVPEAAPWSEPLRVEQLVGQTEVHAPQVTGWISKEVKVKPQRIERYVVTSLVDDGEMLSFRLRAEPGSPSGFDATVDLIAKTAKAARAGAADDAAVGPFELSDADARAFVELGEKLRESTTDLRRGKLRAATLGSSEVAQLPVFRELVTRLVDMMAPIVREISSRSLTPNELVIRRALANDRREEIFVTKATLREKFAALPPDDRVLFLSLGLDPEAQMLDRSKAPAPPPSKPSIRAELPQSHPPPSPPQQKPPVPIPKNRPPRAALAALHALVAGVDPAKASVPPSAASRGTTPAAKPAAGLTPPAPTSSPKEVGRAENAKLAASLKKIALLTTSGRTNEAYAAFGNLFASAAFGDYTPDDQRFAIRTMALAKARPAKSEEVTNAYAAGLSRVEALVKAKAEATDYELLGVTHLLLEDAAAAKEAFAKGLEIARASDASSELAKSIRARLDALA